MATDMFGNWINPDTGRSSGFGMKLGNSLFSNAAGAVSDILGGQSTARSLRLKARGDLAEAGNYDLAAELADNNRMFTAASTRIKTYQADRAALLGTGETASAIAGSGLSLGSGSAVDIMRAGMSEASLTHSVLGQQGQIQEVAYAEQAQAYRNMAAAARYAASEEEGMAGDSERNGWLTGGIKAVAGLASLFTGL